MSTMHAAGRRAAAKRAKAAPGKSREHPQSYEAEGGQRSEVVKSAGDGGDSDQLNREIKQVFGSDDPAGFGIQDRPQAKVERVGDGLQEGDPEESNPDLNEEERARLKRFANMFAGGGGDEPETNKPQQQQYENQNRMEQAPQPIEGQFFYFKDMNKIFKIYDQNSCYIFKGDTCFRRMIVKLSCWPVFDNFIILLILVNSIMLACYDYTDRDSKTPWNQTIDFIGNIFTYIFIGEAAIKIVAMGFFIHKNAYLRDYWNWLDFIVVCIGIVENIPGIPKLKALRTMRVLRPLRSVNAFPQMRRLIGSLLGSIPELGTAVVFLLFIFLLFGILGVQQFNGVLYQRCRVGQGPTFDQATKKWSWEKAPGIDRLCSLKKDDGAFYCPDDLVCGSPTHSNAIPKPFKINPNIRETMMESDDYINDELIPYDLANFNNLIWAMQTIFVMITLEGWSGLMYNLTDASLQWMAIAFCILLVVVGAFFLLNVILAVIMESFDKVDRLTTIIEKQKEEELKQQKKACGILSDSSQSDDEERKENQLDILDVSQDVDKSPDLQPTKNGQGDETQNRSKAGSQIDMTQLGGKQLSSDAMQNTKIINKDDLVIDPSVEQLLRESGTESQTRMLLQDSKKNVNDSVEEGLKIGPKALEVLNLKEPKKGKHVSIPSQEQTQPQSIDMSQLKNNKNLEVDEDVPERARNNKLYLFFFRICMHDLFTFSMTAAILINTLVLALDQYPITYETQSYLEFVNSLLSYIFIVEMGIKLQGMGIKDYTSDSFNNFDGTIVCISIVEMVAEKLFDGSLGGGAFSSLRAVRLLRVFKLARSWTSFRELLEKMIVTLADIQFFGALMILFLFIFTLLGMELFAYRVKYNNGDKEYPVDDKFEGDPYYPRASFNDFFTGFTTIFIVFIGEDWNSVMYDHARAQGDIFNQAGTIVIFVSMFIVGNLIMLNLFLAILLKNFEEPPGKDNVEDTGPGAFTIFKQLIVYKITQCCCSCFASNENQVQDEKLVQDSPLQKANLLQNMSQLGLEQNPVTPLSKKQSQIAEEDGIEKGIIKQSKKGLQAHFNTEQKASLDPDGTEEDIEESARKANAVKRKMYQTKKSFSELKKTMLDANFNSKPSPDPKVLMRMKTMEQSQKSSKRFSISAIKQMEVAAAEQPKSKAMIVTGKSLFLMGPDNPIRKCCMVIVGHQHFDNVVLFLIIFSTLMLTIETPLMDPNSQLSTTLGKIDNVVSALFLMELILKVIVMGFLISGPEPTQQQLAAFSSKGLQKPEHPSAYIRNPWNQMDFIIVAFSIISILFAGADLGAIKTLRMLRVLRPLRMISRNPGLKIAVNSLLNAIPFIGDVIVVSILFLLLFGILCTNFFKGALYSCQVNGDMLFNENDPKNSLSQYAMDQLQANIDEHVNTKFECLDYGGEWVNTDSNFDNVGQSMITLFNVMTTEGWIDVMWSALDSTEIEYVPHSGREFGLVVVFFLVVIFFFNLFLLNMFVGIVINVFSAEKESLEMNHELTQTELDWCDVLIYCYKSEPIKTFVTSGSVIKDTCYSIAMNLYFDRFILFCIIFNTGCLATTWHGEPDHIKEQLYFFNLTFNVIYTIEAIIKLIAFDKEFFYDGWNNFDFIIVVAAWFGFITDELGMDIGASTNVIRIFRICRIFKIIKKFKNLRILFQTFIGAIPQLTNVGGLLMLFLFLYTVLGVEFFATVQLQNDLNVHANFQTFGTALTTLFRCATGESWQAIMYDCSRQKSILFPCSPEPSYETMYQGEGKDLNIDGCGDPAKAYLFFISFMLMVSFIFLNLFIAIILESFDTSKDEEGLQVGGDTISKFNEFWSMEEFDPKGSKFIKIKEFQNFLKLIIDEEIRLRMLYNEALRKGQINYEDQVDGNKIFMFNVHQDVLILPICMARRPNIYKQMVENGEIEDPNMDLNTKTPDGKDVQQEGGADENSEEERIRRKKINDEKKQRQQDAMFEKHLDQFIGSLEIPCYDRCTTFHYYDVLEALSRHLFQQIVDYEREKLEEQQLQEIESNSSKSSSNSSQDLSAREKGSRKSGGSDSDDDKEELSKRQQEEKEDFLNGNLELILKKLEEKGAHFKDIEKYKEMRFWRLKRDKIARQSIESVDIVENGEKQKMIIDSSQLVGARVIMRYTERWLEKKRKQKAADQAAQFDNADPQQREAKRDANIMEKEITRKAKEAQKKKEKLAAKEFEADLDNLGRNSRNRGVRTEVEFDNQEQPGNKQGYDEASKDYASQPLSARRSSKTPRGQGGMAMEGSSLDEYNAHESERMADILSQPGG